MRLVTSAAPLRAALLLSSALVFAAGSARAQPVSPAAPSGDGAPAVVATPPPGYAYTPRAPADLPPVAPRYALWLGGRAGILGFGDAFYENVGGQPETTGNFISPGLGLEVDIGARIAKRFIPYVGVELGIHRPGHRFDGFSNASASSSFVGIGFRSIWIDFTPTIGFMTDLSFGYRTVTVKNDADTYKMGAFELFRLGLGLDIRVSSVFTISPAFTLSGGAMSDASGSITFAPNGQGDGATHPRFENGSIDTEREYLVVNLGCGGHFDLLARYH